MRSDEYVESLLQGGDVRCLHTGDGLYHEPHSLQSGHDVVRDWVLGVYRWREQAIGQSLRQQRRNHLLGRGYL